MIHRRLLAIAVLVPAIAIGATGQPVSTRPSGGATPAPTGTTAISTGTPPAVPRSTNGGIHPVAIDAVASAAAAASAASVAGQAASDVRPTTRNAQSRQATTATQEASGVESKTVDVSPTSK
jgi:hypothetical protein